MNADASDLLPKLTCNKSYIKKKKYLKRKRKAELEREQQINKRVSSAKAKSKKSHKDAPDVKSKKVRKPKTSVSGEKTGKETLLKKKARALVQETKAVKKAKGVALSQEKKDTRASKKGSLTDAKGSTVAASMSDVPLDATGRTSSPTLSSSIHERNSVSHELQPFVGGGPDRDELDRVLIEQTIRGKDYLLGEDARAQARDFIRDDPTLYPPEVAFYRDLAEERNEADLTEEALLDSAHRYFKELNAKEQEIKQAAAAYLKKMRVINRRGGDKDGFRYVLPSSVKQVTRQMMLASNTELSGGKNGAPSLAMVDAGELDSTFKGDAVRETEKKPMRSRRRRSSTFSDFYKFQVSKRWTQNAENFLKRGRAHKALFEAKKRQRSIRKL